MELRELQAFIKEKYYEKDQERGVLKTFLWLVEEIGELSEALREGDIEAINEEIADVLAWTLSLANLLEIDLEESFKRKYMS